MDENMKNKNTMNMRQAKAKAIELWGKMAFVHVSRYHFAEDGITRKKGVGKMLLGIGGKYDNKCFYGWGDTWEEAFERAEKYLKDNSH
jgi:hypothetical protein